MTCTLHVAWDERLTDYHFGPDHPMAPVRVELTMRLAHEFGLWNQPGVTVAAPAPATDTDLQLIHDEQYVTNVKTLSRWAEHPDARDGLPETQLRVEMLWRHDNLALEHDPTIFPRTGCEQNLNRPPVLPGAGPAGRWPCRGAAGGPGGQ